MTEQARLLPETKVPIRLLLLDFDGTLTASHTGGALCFRMNNMLRCLDAATGIVESDFADNVASADAAFTIELLLHLVLECQTCVAIVTMADQGHEEPRERLHLSTAQQRQLYQVVGGKVLVLHWLYCLAVRALKDVDIATAAIDHLLASGRFHVVAKFHPSSKRSHLSDVVDYFQKNRTLLAADLQPSEILYVDDTESLLRDMKKFMPKINTIWSPDGITKKRWSSIDARYRFGAGGHHADSESDKTDE